MSEKEGVWFCRWGTWFNTKTKVVIKSESEERYAVFRNVQELMLKKDPVGVAINFKDATELVSSSFS